MFFILLGLMIVDRCHHVMTVLIRLNLICYKNTCHYQIIDTAYTDVPHKRTTVCKKGFHKETSACVVSMFRFVQYLDRDLITGMFIHLITKSVMHYITGRFDIQKVTHKDNLSTFVGNLPGCVVLCFLTPGSNEKYRFTRNTCKESD